MDDRHYEASSLPRSRSHIDVLTPSPSAQRGYSSVARPSSSTPISQPRSYPPLSSTPKLWETAATSSQKIRSPSPNFQSHCRLPLLGRGKFPIEQPELDSLISRGGNDGDPLTPFPPYKSNSDRQNSLEQGTRGCHFRHDGLRMSMHGLVLALQAISLWGIFCLFVGITVWQGDDSRFWDYLWMYFQPPTGLTCLFCLVMLLIHETARLSDLAFLYTQVVLLVVTSISELCLAWWAFEQTNRMVIGSAVGAGTVMLGVVVAGFVRAKVIWWVNGHQGGRIGIHEN